LVDAKDEYDIKHETQNSNSEHAGKLAKNNISDFAAQGADFPATWTCTVSR
jgi:hypothetical protein